jgi:uncharacterized delta-60 repeat protein
VRTATTLATLAVALLAASPAPAFVGPGRVTVPLSAAASVRDRVLVAPLAGVALPDGGALLAGPTRHGNLNLMALRRDGSLDPAIGVRGVPLPAGDRAATVPVIQVLRRPDGEVLVVYTSTRGHLLVAALPAGAAELDPRYGQGGVADSGIAGGAATLLADGAVALTGSATAPPPAPGRWVVVRLTRAGALDSTFGDRGTATLPGTTGMAIAAFPDGSLAVGGQSDGEGRLARLTPAGALDPVFGAGAPVATGLPAGVAAHADGSLDLLVAGRDDAYVEGFAGDGTVDASFGAAGRVPIADTEVALAVAPDGSDIVVGATSAVRIAFDGSSTGTGDPTGAFLGGRSGALPPAAAVHVRYLRGTPIVRADGSVLVPGAVGVLGGGRLHEEEAAYSLTRELTADRAFGGRAMAPTVRLTVRVQRAGARIAATLGASAPGVAIVKARHGTRLLGSVSVPVFAAGRQSVRIALERAPRTGTRVTVSVELRDLLRGTSTAERVIRLR